VRNLLLFVLVLFTLPVYAVNSAEVDTQSRVVAFGDVHGAYPELVQLLGELGVIDANTDWQGGDTHLVSLGDLIDRGADSRRVVELIMKLQRQATAAGGAVHVVLGNHEVMVMTGDLRYVSRAEFAAFAGDETAQEREALFEVFRATLPDLDEEAQRLKFEEAAPPGYLGLQRAYAPHGEFGRWLLELPMVLRVNDSLYAHGGISSAMAEKSLGAINADNKGELLDYLARVEALRAAGVLPPFIGFWERRDWLNTVAEAILAEDPKARPAWFEDFVKLAELEGAQVFGSQSPIWYRGNIYCHPYAESFNTERILKATSTRQLVVGHTPRPAGPQQRMEGQVIRLDTGMLKSVYKGLATALVQQGGDQYIHTAGVSGQSQPVILPRSMSQTLWKMDDQELEAIMRRGDIVNSEFIGTGITKPKRLQLQLGSEQMTAGFKYEDSDPGLQDKSRFITRSANDSDRYQYDVAAYRLDRMLDLQMVPVTVLRDIEGEEGAVSAWIPNTINERDRLEQEVAFGGHCLKDEQYRLRFLFDVLIFNEDRNLTNILWTKDDFMLQFLDHSLAFRSTERRPKQYRKVDLRLSDLFAKKLNVLTEENLQAQLRPYLHPRQIEAILARRDLILKQALRTDP
jgi:hypothetical protein